MERLSTCSCARKFGRASTEVSPAHALRPFPRCWPARCSFGLRAAIGCVVCSGGRARCNADLHHHPSALPSVCRPCSLARCPRRTSQRDGPRGPHCLHHVDRGPAHDRAPLKYPPCSRHCASISAPLLFVQFVASLCDFSPLSIPSWLLQQHRVRFPQSSMCGLSSHKALEAAETTTM